MHALWALIGDRAARPRVPRRAARPRRPRLPRLGRPGGGELRQGRARRSASAVVALADDPAPDVRLQVAIASRKIEGVDPLAGPARRASTAARTTRSSPRSSGRTSTRSLDDRAGDFVRLVAAKPTSAESPRLAILPPGGRTAARRAQAPARGRLALVAQLLAAAARGGERRGGPPVARDPRRAGSERARSPKASGGLRDLLAGPLAPDPGGRRPAPLYPTPPSWPAPGTTRRRSGPSGRF